MRRTVCAGRTLCAHVLIVCAFVIAFLTACGTKREDPAPTFRNDVGPLLGAKCLACHAGESAAGGYRVTSYLETIGCVASDGAPATRPSDAPILRALARPDHAGLLNDDEHTMLERWVAAGAPAFASGVHPASFVDPRSPDSHARFLRARRWKPMLDASDPDACVACHDGTPARPDRPRSAAPGATKCTSCHTESGGPLGCSTCHGQSPGQPYPPRDACFFPDARPIGAHAAHVEASAAKSTGIACATCHPTPTLGLDELSATHGDGRVQVWLAEGADRFDATTGRCATACHAGPGAARPAPAWSETTKMTCADCHGAPPTPHLAGPCSNCHREANATGTALTATKLHLDGKVELGDGSGGCGACHGHGDDPWPTTGAHAAHEAPKTAVKVECTTCHAVPNAGEPHPLGTPKATVRLLGLAAKGGLAPTYEPTTGTCANVYCHALRGAATPTPTWTGAAVTCTSCHGIPPSAPHTTATSCGTTTCHAGSIESGVLTPAGVAHHVDGTIDLSVP